MAALQQVGAAAPGPVTPSGSDNARWQAGVIEGQTAEQSREYADVAGVDQALDRDLALAARAATLGIELRALGSDAWLLRHARGGDIGAVRGHGPLLAAIAAFEAPSYTPTLAAGNVAGDVLTSVQTARGAMRGLGNTGWGTPTMATAANVLASLGVKDAANYAGNSQVFQQAAMERLWGTLNAAKGPQTEGDADRAAKTFASLQNTPKANEYILDLAQARAERDQMKANFFRQALPLGQRAGDLQQIEREWQTRQPSIFNMPSMRKWGQQ